MSRSDIPEEVRRLRRLEREFSLVHPALAPMLDAPVADPDVERLIDAVSFQSALLRRKLDESFPELVQELTALAAPHFLRPLPATTIVAFTPEGSAREPRTVPAGTEVASTPVAGTSCFFRTAYDVELHPMRLTVASFSNDGGTAAIRLHLSLTNLPLSQWRPRALRLHLGGGYAAAADLYLLLQRHVKRVVVTPLDGGESLQLPPDFLVPVGFDPAHSLFPYPSSAYPGFRILQEYFHAPQKFLFFDLTGWDRWQDRGEGSRLEIAFELDDLPGAIPAVTRESFLLFATPAVNLFPHDAAPIVVDHHTPHYLVTPGGAAAHHYQIFSVDSVTGIGAALPGPRQYLPLDSCCTTSPQRRYHCTFRPQPSGKGLDLLLHVLYPPGELPERETLSITLTCTNGALAESLRVGDVCLPAPDSVACAAAFRNVTPVTPAVLPPLDSRLQQRLLAHLSLNRFPLDSARKLRALLALYLFPDAACANSRRVAGIRSLSVSQSRCCRAGGAITGRDVLIKLRQENFSGAGDRFLFGCVLDHFFGGYAAFNTFTRLTVEEAERGEVHQWPARLGAQQLI